MTGHHDDQVDRDQLGRDLVRLYQDYPEPDPDGEFRRNVVSVVGRSAWPDPIGDAAYHGLTGYFVRSVLPHTEADPAALLLTFLAAVGSAVGNSPHVLLGSDRHHAKLWPVLVGGTSSGRKGSSQGWVERVMAEADPSWSERHATNLGSGEVLVWTLRDKRGDDDGVADKRLWVAESEFSSLLRVAGRDGSVLSGMLRQAWDRDTLRHTTKHAPATATGAHVTVLGHITPQELRKELRSTEAANGFGNRFLWVAVRRSKMLPRGGGNPAQELRATTDALRDVIAGAKTVGRVHHAESFWQVYEPRYRELTSDHPGLAGTLTGRGAPYVHRPALVYALLDSARTITDVHARAALAVWDYCAASARHLFSGNTGDSSADELLRELRDQPNGMTRTQLRDLFSRNRSVGPALETLQQLGLAYCVKEQTGPGRPTERWHATPTTYDRNDQTTERTEP